LKFHKLFFKLPKWILKENKIIEHLDTEPEKWVSTLHCHLHNTGQSILPWPSNEISLPPKYVLLRAESVAGFNTVNVLWSDMCHIRVESVITMLSMFYCLVYVICVVTMLSMSVCVEMLIYMSISSYSKWRWCRSYLTLRSVSSLNNPQNMEMKICEKYEVVMLKIIIIIISYILNKFSIHIKML